MGRREGSCFRPIASGCSGYARPLQRSSPPLLSTQSPPEACSPAAKGTEVQSVAAPAAAGLQDGQRRQGDGRAVALHAWGGACLQGRPCCLLRLPPQVQESCSLTAQQQNMQAPTAPAPMLTVSSGRPPSVLAHHSRPPAQAPWNAPGACPTASAPPPYRSAQTALRALPAKRPAVQLTLLL